MYGCDIRNGTALSGIDVSGNNNIKLIKSHDNLPGNTDVDYYVQVIRNPLECIIRHNQKDVENGVCGGTKWRCGKTDQFTRKFIENVVDYHNYTGDKILLYYEDIISNPEQSLHDLVSLIGEPTSMGIGEIMENIDSISSESLTSHIHTKGVSSENSKQLIKHSVGISDEHSSYYRESLKVLDDCGLIKRYKI